MNKNEGNAKDFKKQKYLTSYKKIMTNHKEICLEYNSTSTNTKNTIKKIDVKCPSKQLMQNKKNVNYPELDLMKDENQIYNFDMNLNNNLFERKMRNFNRTNKRIIDMKLKSKNLSYNVKILCHWKEHFPNREIISPNKCLKFDTNINCEYFNKLKEFQLSSISEKQYDNISKRHSRKHLPFNSKIFYNDDKEKEIVEFSLYKDHEIGLNKKWQEPIIDKKKDDDVDSDQSVIDNALHDILIDTESTIKIISNSKSLKELYGNTRRFTLKNY